MILTVLEAPVLDLVVRFPDSVVLYLLPGCSTFLGAPLDDAASAEWSKAYGLGAGAASRAVCDMSTCEVLSDAMTSIVSRLPVSAAFRPYVGWRESHSVF